MKKNQMPKTSRLLKMRRRDILRFISGTTVVALLGCKNKSSNSAEQIEGATQSRADFPGCIVRPQQTEGPYFVDERLNRSDIRSDPSDGLEKEGVLLKLAFKVNQVSPDACLPIEGAIVDIWHCDAQGVYSDVSDPNFDTLGQKFLRGYQITDANGTVEFATIYPGWYPGRTTHIHFKIRGGENSKQSYEFTSQLYFRETVSNQIFTQSPYNIREQSRIRNDQDGIFRNGGDLLIMELTHDSATGAYAGIFNVGLELR